MTMVSKISVKELHDQSRETLFRYLRNGTGEGKRFFKAKYIARDLGMTSKEVGTNMKILSERCPDLHIEKWSYSKSTTWRVEYAPAASVNNSVMVKA